MDIKSLGAYIPIDRLQAWLRGENLPDRANGAVLFADISGFTLLTEALVHELGPRHGAEELTSRLNRLYEALIAEVYHYGGSVVTFSGDGITCWFDEDKGGRAVAAGLAIQQTMAQFAATETPAGNLGSIGVKVAVAAGPVRRFLVGDPTIQCIDVLAGATLDRVTAAEKQARKGEVVVSPEVVAHLGDQLTFVEFRLDTRTGLNFAVVTGLAATAVGTAWPALPADPLAFLEGAKEPSEAWLRRWLLPPVYERWQSGQDQFLAEMRRVVAFFLNFRLNFHRLDYDRDEAAGDKLDAYIRWVQHILALHEGSLIQLTIGDKGSYLYAVFGAPLAHDDDPSQAVAAALALQTLPPGLDFVTKVRIGISQGRMRTGAYGSRLRRTYGVLGDEVNIAARLMQQARPGQIVVSERIAEAVTEDYYLEYVGPIKVKGRQKAIPVSLVLASRSHSLREWGRPLTNSLVGRNQELTHLEQILKDTLSGQGQMVRLEGAAGVGKSHLVMEFAKRAIRQGVRVALGACQNTSQDMPYVSWRQILRALFVLTEANPPPQQITQVEMILAHMNRDWLIRLPLLGDLLGLPTSDNATTAAFEPQLRQEALFTLAGELLQAWAQDLPLLLLIEDAHWIDEASLALTLTLQRVLSTAPVMFMLIHRPLPQPRRPDLSQLRPDHHLVLAELIPSAVAQLVVERLQGPVSPLALAFLQVQAQGNPFFVEELVDTLLETGRLQRSAGQDWELAESMVNALRQANCLVREEAFGQWLLRPEASLATVRLDLPDAIHGLVLAHLDRLPESHKLTLKVASVIGPAFTFDLLAQAHPSQPESAVLLAQLELIQARDLIYHETSAPHRSYMFKHHLIQEVTYKNLLVEQQRDLHQAVGEAQERLQPGAVEMLAYHFSRSSLRDKSLLYLDKAAQKAQREYANETALLYYNQALALAEHWPWRRGQVEVLHILSRREEEITSLQILAANSEAPAFEVAYLWGRYHEALGDFGPARMVIEQALKVQQEMDDPLNKARCLALLGLITRRQGDLDQAKAWYNQALALIQDSQAYLDERAQALDGLGMVYLEQANYDQAKTCYEQARELSQTSGNRRDEAKALNDLGILNYYRRNFGEAIKYHHQALEIRQTIGDRAGQGSSFINLAQTMRDAGDYGQAREYLQKALKIAQETGDLWDETNVWNELGILYLMVGHLPEAEHCLQEALNLGRKLEDKMGQAMFLGNLGLVKRDLGDLATAEALLNESLAMAMAQKAKGFASMCLSYLGTVSWRAGDLDQAINRATAALTLRRELADLRLLTTMDLTTLAQAYQAAGEVALALDYTWQALTILKECDGLGPEFPQHDYFYCYRVLSKAGQPEAAQEALQAAYKIVTTQAENITDSAMRQSFLALQINHEIVAAAKQLMAGSQA